MTNNEDWVPGCREVLEEVLDERRRQVAQYGHNYDLKDGTGAGTLWLLPYTHDNARDIQVALRADYEEHERFTGQPTWLNLVREEICEAFQEAGEERLRAELTQVAALCVSWIEKLDKIGPTP